MINNVYSLPELDFVGGSSEDLVFHVYCDKTNPKPFGLTGCTANFSIINFVNKNGAPVVSKTMTVRMDESETFTTSCSYHFSRMTPLICLESLCTKSRLRILTTM